MGTTRKKTATKTQIRAHAPRKSSTRRSNNSGESRRLFLISKRSILAVIIIAMLVVVFALIFTKFYDPEKAVTKKIEEITADYYETYFYPRINNNGTADKPISEIIARYKDTGFSKITLRQLLLFDSARHSDLTDFLTKYCDEEATYVKIFPDEPYSSTDYHVDYHYSCEF